ncbi:MAG TPA: hypothetical protein VGD27_05590 [Longimicrobiales bacterium]
MRPYNRGLLCVTVVAATACGGASAGGEQKAARVPAESPDIERIRRATEAFHSIEAAAAAGYAANVPNCVAHAEHGAMGFHHANRTLFDDKLEVEHPEILVYERMPDGKYVFNGVEYVVPYEVRPREAEPPVLMGQQLKRADGLQLWYLHVWIWKNNVNGLFADWNPGVECRS